MLPPPRSGLISKVPAESKREDKEVGLNLAGARESSRMNQEADWSDSGVHDDVDGGAAAIGSKGISGVNPLHIPVALLAGTQGNTLTSSHHTIDIPPPGSPTLSSQNAYTSLPQANTQGPMDGEVISESDLTSSPMPPVHIFNPTYGALLANETGAKPLRYPATALGEEMINPQYEGLGPADPHNLSYNSISLDSTPLPKRRALDSTTDETTT